jgi:hypothetical protein
MLDTLLEAEIKAIGAIVAALDDADTSMFPRDTQLSVYYKASESMAGLIRRSRVDTLEKLIPRAAAIIGTIKSMDSFDRTSDIYEAVWEHVEPKEKIRFFINTGEHGQARQAFHKAVEQKHVFHSLNYLMDLAEMIAPDMPPENKVKTGLAILHDTKHPLRICEFAERFPDFKFSQDTLTVGAMRALNDASRTYAQSAKQAFDRFITPIYGATNSARFAISEVGQEKPWLAEQFVEASLAKGGADGIKARHLLMRASGDAQSIGMRKIGKRINDALGIPFNLEACFDDMVRAAGTPLESAYDPIFITLARCCKDTPVWNDYSIPYFIGEPLLDLPSEQLRPYAEKAVQALNGMKDTTGTNRNWLGLYLFTKEALQRIDDSEGMKSLEAIAKELCRIDEPNIEPEELTRDEPPIKSPEFMKKAQEAYDTNGIYGIASVLKEWKGEQHSDAVDVLEKILEERGVEIGTERGKQIGRERLIRTREAVRAHRQILEYQLETGTISYGLGCVVLDQAWSVLSTPKTKDPLVQDKSRLAMQFAMNAINGEEALGYPYRHLYEMEPVIAMHVRGFQFPQSAHRLQAAKHINEAANRIAREGEDSSETDSYVASRIYMHIGEHRMLTFLEANGLYNPKEDAAE